MENRKVLNEDRLEQVNGGVQDPPRKDEYENIILNDPDRNLRQTYRKDIGRDKNAKIIFF